MNPQKKQAPKAVFQARLSNFLNNVKSQVVILIEFAILSSDFSYMYSSLSNIRIWLKSKNWPLACCQDS